MRTPLYIEKWHREEFFGAYSGGEGGVNKTVRI